MPQRTTNLWEFLEMSARCVPVGNLWPISDMMLLANTSILFGVPPMQTN